MRVAIHRSLLISLVMLILSGCNSGPPSYELNIYSAMSGRGNVSVHYLDGGVVMLTGWVEDSYSKMAVERAAAKSANVKKVISRIEVPWMN